jgi:hypothetical protein
MKGSACEAPKELFAVLEIGIRINQNFINFLPSDFAYLQINFTT